MQEMLEGALRCEGQGCADGAGGALCPAGEAVSIRRRVGLGLAIGMRSAFPGSKCPDVHMPSACSAVTLMRTPAIFCAYSHDFSC